MLKTLLQYRRKFHQAKRWAEVVRMREAQKTNNELGTTNHEDKIREKEILIFSPKFAI